MTATLEHVLDIPLDRLAAHPRNVRRHLGDLRDLTRSIRERGIETPLLVLAADGAGVHHIVAGHRRRAAAEAAGLTSMPCIVRDFANEADVVLSMLAENTQRSDGLNVVDEAQALAAVIDLRGGTVSARKLAAAVGHSEGWVRTRLSLLALPDAALDALHAGTITIDVAQALTALAEQPELVEQLVARRGLSVWQVEAAHRQQLTDQALTDATAALDAVGITAVTEDDWREHQRAWKALDELGIDATAHRDESCHAVVVKCRYDATVVEIPVCTEPRRHRGRNPDSELVATAAVSTATDEDATVERRERRQATDTRASWLTDRLATARAIPTGEVFPLAVVTWIDSAPYVTLQRVVKLLGITIDSDGYVDHAGVVLGHLESEPKRLTAVALALVAATAEERARQSLGSPMVARYLDAIERLGYQPTDWEHPQRLTNAACR
jgi:ParB/RepB/Spo0J family partition protein